MTDMMSFVDFIVLALGAYMIYSAFSLRKGGDLSSNLIWDKKIRVANMLPMIVIGLLLTYVPLP